MAKPVPNCQAIFEQSKGKLNYKQAAEKQGLLVEEGMAKYTGCFRGRVFSPTPRSSRR